MSVIDGGLNYILGKQSNCGEFPITGAVHNFELLVQFLLNLAILISVAREEQRGTHCLHYCRLERVYGHIRGSF